MVWKCPKLFRYWRGIITRINKTFKSSLEPEAKTCLLGCLEEDRVLPGIIEVVLRCLFQARKLIAQKWQAQAPPTVESWTATINSMVWSERVLYIMQNNIRKFETMWGPGCREWDVPYECPCYLFLSLFLSYGPFLIYSPVNGEALFFSSSPIELDNQHPDRYRQCWGDVWWGGE